MVKIPKSDKLNILFILITIIFLISTKIVVERLYDNYKNKKDNEYLREEFVHKDKKTKDTKIDFKKLKSINSDIVGWIKIPKTNINYPIVQTTDNSYYLNHDFYKKRNINGSIFMNYENRNDFSDLNIILFGHHTRNGSMFSNLKDIYNEKIDGKINVYIYTENKNYVYSIYSMYLTDPSDGEPLNTGQSFYTKSIKDFNIDLDKTQIKQTLTLSTCNDDSSKRIVIHAYLNE